MPVLRTPETKKESNISDLGNLVKKTAKFNCTVASDLNEQLIRGTLLYCSIKAIKNFKNHGTVLRTKTDLTVSTQQCDILATIKLLYTSCTILHGIAHSNLLIYLIHK